MPQTPGSQKLESQTLVSQTLGIVELETGRDASNGGNRISSLAGRRFASRTLLEWVVRRATDALRLDRVVVLCDDLASRQRISQWTPADVDIHVGLQRDPLARFAALAQKYKADAVVRMRIDNPFVDSELIDRLVNAVHATPDCDYGGYVSADGRPAMLSQMGVLAEWCSTSAILQADRLAVEDHQRRDAMAFVVSHPETFQLKLIPLPKPLDRRDVRLTIQDEQDWEQAQVILDALGPDNLDWPRLARFLISQPNMRREMAELNRIHADRKRN